MPDRFNLTDSLIPNLVNSPSRRSASERVREAALTKPVDDFLSRPGKRIRADLIEVAFRIGGGTGQPPQAVIEFVELLHAGSLIIDDIQDNSRNRRQQETMHLKYGVPLAINTGNWMYFAALEHLTSHEFPGGQSPHVLQRVIQVIKQCHEGQALDLAARFDRVAPQDYSEIIQTISRDKTGSLTGLAAWLGGMSAGATEACCEQLFDFGMQLGIGLQMQNDFVELQKVASSRASSDDMRNRRITWCWGWLAEQTTPEEVRQIAKLACSQTPDVSLAAQRILEKIDFIAVNAINQKLEGSLSNLPGVEFSVRHKLEQIVTTLELQYV